MTRLLLLAAALLLISTGAAHAQTPRQLVAFYEATELRGAGADGDSVVPLTCALDCQTPMVATLAVGPIELKAGDLVDVRLRHEFTNSNTAQGAWTVLRCCDALRVQSEHWGLWLMAAAGVLRGPAVDPAAGWWVMNPLAENFDNYVHHKIVDRSSYSLITKDATQYFYTRVYFASSAGYTLPGATVRVEGGAYARLQVAVFREASGG